MSSSTEKIENLFKTLNETVSSLISEFLNLKVELKSKQDEIDELENPDEEGGRGDSEIDCGIGLIEYYEPTNIALQSVMENLEAAIKKTNPKVVNEVLEAI